MKEQPDLMKEQPDLMKAMKASLDAVKARDDIEDDILFVVSSKHDELCMKRKVSFPLLCSCGVSEEEFQSVKERITQSEMTPAQALDHRHAAEAGRQADALKAFRSCLHLASSAEGNGDEDVASDHRADAIKTLAKYPEILAAIETAVGETIR